MSHEIRTPLNAIIGFSDLLCHSSLVEQQKEQAETIRSSGETLLQIINGILDFSKIEAGKLELDYVEYSLEDISKGIRDIFQIAARNKNLFLEISIAPNAPRNVLCDPARLLQVLRNLVSNAIKFTDSGGVTLKITRGEAGEIEEHLTSAPTDDESESAWLRFSVKDTGIGISSEAQDRLFQSFSQGDSSMARKYGGTGLGLAICRKLCRLMGGEIWLQSSAPQGSEFVFYIRVKIIPANALSAPSVSLQKGNTLPMASPAVQNLRILLVEDNAINRKLMVSMLARFGIAPEQAANGVEALDKVKTAPFDGIFMDLQMPEMDGFFCTSKIRDYEASAGRSPSHIVALTAAVFAGDRQKCFESGMDWFLSKPVKLEELHQILEKLANPPRIVTGSRKS